MIHDENSITLCHRECSKENTMMKGTVLKVVFFFFFFLKKQPPFHKTPCPLRNTCHMSVFIALDANATHLEKISQGTNC